MHPSCGGSFFTLCQVTRRSRVILTLGSHNGAYFHETVGGCQCRLGNGLHVLHPVDCDCFSLSSPSFRYLRRVSRIISCCARQSGNGPVGLELWLCGDRILCRSQGQIGMAVGWFVGADTCVASVPCRTNCLTNKSSRRAGRLGSRWSISRRTRLICSVRHRTHWLIAIHGDLRNRSHPQ